MLVIASGINFDLQAVPPACSGVITAEGWHLKLTGDRQQLPDSPHPLYLQSRLPQAGAIWPAPVVKKSPDPMGHHDRNEESRAPGFMAGLALVLKVYQSLQALFDGSSPAPAMGVAGGGAAGGGDDGDDDDSHNETFQPEPQPEFFAWLPVSLAQFCLKQKQRLLRILHKKMQWAQACGNRDLARILRDRITLMEIDQDSLQQQTLHSDLLSRLQMQEMVDKGQSGNTTVRSGHQRRRLSGIRKLFFGKTGSRLRWQRCFRSWRNVKTGWANRNCDTEK